MTEDEKVNHVIKHILLGIGQDTGNLARDYQELKSTAKSLLDKHNGDVHAAGLEALKAINPIGVKNEN